MIASRDIDDVLSLIDADHSPEARRARRRVQAEAKRHAYRRARSLQMTRAAARLCASAAGDKAVLALDKRTADVVVHRGTYFAHELGDRGWE